MQTVVYTGVQSIIGEMIVDSKQVATANSNIDIEELVRRWVRQCPNCMYPMSRDTVMGSLCSNCGVKLYTCYVCLRMPDSKPEKKPN